MYCVYLLISETGKKSYVGFSSDFNRRVKDHKDKKVGSTKDFGKFKFFILEKNIPNEWQAVGLEKYWKSCAGRKKLKEFFKK